MTTNPAGVARPAGSLADQLEFKRRWSAAVTVGGWCTIGDPYAAEIVSRAGYQWICIDAQHGMVDDADVVGMLQAIAVAGVPALVRVRWNRPEIIGRALDAGAQGVIVPMVNDAASAEAAVRACRYAPEGQRSYGPARAALRASDFSVVGANEATICVVMLETVQAIEAIDTIVAVPGIDGVFVGPSDLALTEGFAPNVRCGQPEHVRRIERVATVCEAAGITAGIYAGGADSAKLWRDRGYRMLATNADAVLLRQGAQALLADLDVPQLQTATDGEIEEPKSPRT
jgi:4-hydroxy-2-oxoheptanedioate aldolase